MPVYCSNWEYEMKRSIRTLRGIPDRQYFLCGLKTDLKIFVTRKNSLRAALSCINYHTSKQYECGGVWIHLLLALLSLRPILGDFHRGELKCVSGRRFSKQASVAIWYLLFNHRRDCLPACSFQNALQVCQKMFLQQGKASLCFDSFPFHFTEGLVKGCTSMPLI